MLEPADYNSNRRQEKILCNSWEEFVQGIKVEFCTYSAIDEALFHHAVQTVSDLEPEAGGEWADPIAEFLDWKIKETQQGFSAKRTVYAALFACEDGKPFQAKLNYATWNEQKGDWDKPYRAPSGNGAIAYLAPVPASIREKVGKRYNLEVPLEGSFWDWVAAHPEVEILITEGVKKTLAGLSQGIVTIGLYGCNSGYLRGEEGYHLIPELTHLVHGRKVLIGFDQDKKFKTQERVANARNTTASLLQREKAIPYYVKWKPEAGKGLDDLIVKKGSATFLKAIAQAELIPQLQVPVLREFDPNSNAAKNVDPYRVTDRAISPDHHLNIHFFKAEGNWCVLDGTYHRHEGTVWLPVADSEVETTLTEELKKLYEIRVEKNGEERQIYKFGNGRALKSVFTFNRSDLNITAGQRPDSSKYINFLNGVLDVETQELLPYSRDLYLNSQIQANYFPLAECPHEFKSFINSAYGVEQTELIRALIRYSIDSSLPPGKFFHLIGESGSGKGSLIRFLGSIHGPHYRAASDLSILSTPETRYQNLTGARLVAFPDLAGVLPKLGAFYELVDNGQMTQRPLYSSTIYTLKPNARFIVASTEHFQFEKSDAGWDRRCIPIATRGRAEADDTGLSDRLEACKAQVISWAMGLSAKETQEILWNASKHSPYVEELKIQQAIASDSVKGFVDACLTVEEGSFVSMTTAYGWYKAYCVSTGQHPKARPRFISTLKEIVGGDRIQKRSSKVQNGIKVNVPVMFRDFHLVNKHLFQPQRLSGGELASPELGLYLCNAEYLQDGHLCEFNTPSTPSKNNTRSKPEPIDSAITPITPSTPSSSLAHKEEEKKIQNPPQKEIKNISSIRGGVENQRVEGVIGVTLAQQELQLTPPEKAAGSRESNPSLGEQKVDSPNPLEDEDDWDEDGWVDHRPQLSVGQTVYHNFHWWTVAAIEGDQVYLRSTGRQPKVVPISSIASHPQVE